ncbi:MAG: shikimate kinase [Candidatus Taylorbacteria bacterium CG11_big_fil_rev_8_21_14_0_20_46_11]|uniref:Shikimate kinase n=1 Tax=Candidatus Taylorbacteria bacterium CG11_big_fil_rev_8_21_14_0_20_46_11 TaxID=1975025 RepID=A0A2H0KCU5_9BACT|nr:MAG: shikimate kinase [Candidatus Taylorbacteria bacterium CG11_big_fil_rev_8_21_14_0_20_46_11]
MKHIILIGFKSVGKTVIGKRLAQMLGRTFLDLDVAVERKHGKGMSCRAIVASEGEEAFRTLESGALADILKTNESVILALGGGAVMSSVNQELLRAHTVVYISASPDALFERIMKGGRPAFFSTDLTDRKAFDKLYTEREPIYEKSAKFKVQNEKGVKDTVEKIIKILHHTS